MKFEDQIDSYERGFEPPDDPAPEPDSQACDHCSECQTDENAQLRAEIAVLKDELICKGFERDSDLNAFMRFVEDELGIHKEGHKSFGWRMGFTEIKARIEELQVFRTCYESNKEELAWSRGKMGELQSELDRLVEALTELCDVYSVEWRSGDAYQIAAWTKAAELLASIGGEK